MNSLLFQISSFTIFFGHSEAIPVPNRPFGEKNVALFGVLTCIGIGAVIGMCVFCKKKKGHFKKFENDGNIEEVKNTEYPILKSLNALDAKKSGAIIPSSPTNLSTDNLLDQTVQYQNESVSSHDLDGIENYHLLQYQNETYAAKTQSVRHVGKESVSSEVQQELPKVMLHGDDNDDSNSNMLLSTSKESLSSVSPLPGTKTSYSMEQETASLKNSVGFGDDKPLIDRSSTDLETGGMMEEEDDSGPVNISVQPPTRLDDVTISISDRGCGSFYEEPTSAATTGTTKDCGIQEDVTPMDSLEDSSSVHETNSIEEALRALDIAIDGEDESDDSDDESNFVDYPEDNLDKGPGQRNDAEVRNEMFDGKNSSSDSGMDEIEISEKVTTPDIIMHELIRDEATKLVDEVLLLCQSRIEEIKECEEKERLEAELPLPDDDFNDFNRGVVLECSTPFVARRAFDAMQDGLPMAKQALFCDANEETYVMAEGVEQLGDSTTGDAKQQPEECENAFTTFNKPNVTNADEDDHDDLVQIYPVNETVTIPHINTTHTLPNPSDTFVRGAADGTLPEIMIDAMQTVDDAASDKPTATPMNTPIELGCPTTADWDRWLSASSAATCEATGGGLDLQGQLDEDYFGGHTYDEGWFLHAQPGCSSSGGMYANEGGDGNETYEVQENEDNLDSTYDLLRKQLAEMLPFAQGAKEAAECFEENDTSPNHYGIQYGDLDEASNAPSTSAAKENEMIINYKRTLSPIMEESEDESFYNKTSYYKEASHYVESTSTGCMESLTAMGVNKTLMASNDTLFNFEDVLDEILSPRVPSQSHTPTNRDREIPDYFLRSPRHELSSATTTATDSGTSTGSEANRQPPKSLEFAPQWPRDSSLSSPGDPTRIDFSQDSTFTLDEKTCISLSKPTNEEDERISEISEPILVSSTSGLIKQQPQEDNNSLMDEDIASIEDDSFNEILEKEKPLENEQYNHFLDLHSTAAESVLTGLEPPEPDENFDPASTVLVAGSAGQKDAVLLQNKLNLENTYNNRGIDEQVVVIESIDRFLLKSRNVSLPEDKSTNPLVNGHISSGKLSSRSDGKNICINYDN